MVRAKHAPSIESHDTGSLRGDLLSSFCGPHGMGHTESTGLLGAVITAVGSDPEFAAQFREAFIAPKVAVSRAIYDRAVRRGEISPDVDIDMIAPALAGIILHRTFVLGLPADDATVQRVIDHVILPAVGCGIPAPTAVPSTVPKQQKEARNP
jgi:hypothetical protein